MTAEQNPQAPTPAGFNPGAFLTNIFGDRYLPSINRNTFDKVGSDAVFQRHFEGRLEREDSLHIIIGTDSGLLPTWLAKRGIPDGSRVLFIELPEVIETLGDALDNDKLPERMAVTPLDSWLDYVKPFAFADY